MPLKKINKLFSAVKEASRLKTAEILLDNSALGKTLYRSFTARHPKYLIIRKKTTGVALIRLGDFENGDTYLRSVSGKNSAAYFSRKAAKAGYTFAPIDPNQMNDEILSINNSASSRQGKEMDESYKKKIPHYPADKHNSYFGILHENKLVAYLWVVRSGELAILNRILGHAGHLDAGIMYLMVTSFATGLLKEPDGIKYIMYDTFLGATDGLKMFKKRCGFVPYNVKWKPSK